MSEGTGREGNPDRNKEAQKRPLLLWELHAKQVTAERKG